jgi:cyclic lactone autoinducer peptide
MQKLKLYLLRYAATSMLAASTLFILPACMTGLYQPQVPEHLQDHE